MALVSVEREHATLSASRARSYEVYFTVETSLGQRLRAFVKRVNEAEARVQLRRDDEGNGQYGVVVAHMTIYYKLMSKL